MSTQLPKLASPHIYGEMHSGPDVPADQSTRHSEVVQQPLARCTLGLEGALQHPPSASGSLELGRWVLMLSMALTPMGSPFSVCGAAGKPELSQLNNSLFGWAGGGKGREGLAWPGPPWGVAWMNLHPGKPLGGWYQLLRSTRRDAEE